MTRGGCRRDDESHPACHRRGGLRRDMDDPVSRRLVQPCGYACAVGRTLTSDIVLQISGGRRAAFSTRRWVDAGGTREGPHRRLLTDASKANLAPEPGTPGTGDAGRQRRATGLTARRAAEASVPPSRPTPTPDLEHIVNRATPRRLSQVGRRGAAGARGARTRSSCTAERQTHPYWHAG